MAEDTLVELRKLIRNATIPTDPERGSLHAQIAIATALAAVVEELRDIAAILERHDFMENR